MSSELDPRELEPMALDRELRRAAEAWRRWRRQLRGGTGYEEDPFLYAREFLTRPVFAHLRELGADDPLALPLSRWVYRLSEQRVNRVVIAGVAHAWNAERHPLDAPEQGRFSLAELARRALEQPGRRSQWYDALFSNAATLSERGAILWQRRAELAERAGLAGPDSIELVCPEAGELASAWLTRTQDLAESELPQRDLPALIDVALGTDAAEGWPARVSPRSVEELFARTRLLESLELDPGPLPDTIAPASFVRALMRVGAAFGDATAPRRQPFVLSHDAYGLRRRELGALFGLLPLLPAFVRSRLGLGRDRAQRHRRALGRAWLVASRVQALKVLLRPSAYASRRDLTEALEAGIERALGAGVSGVVPHAFLRLHVDDSQRFAGLLRGAARHEALLDEHDEDWFDNPRAADQLRSEAALTPPVVLSRAELEAASDACYRFMLEVIA